MSPRAATAIVAFSPRELRRRGLEVALRASGEVELAAVTGECRELLPLTLRHRAGGVIADLEGADDDDIESLRHIAATQGESIIIVCFARRDHPRVATVASFAYVLRPRDGLDLAIAALHGQRSWHLQQRQDTRRDVLKLTRRETQVLERLARGLSASEAARELGISPKTIDVHKRNLYAKLGARSQVEAVAVALRRAILAPPLPGEDRDFPSAQPVASSIS
jgi:DNA-binding NarL/FixJ family response regulator